MHKFMYFYNIDLYNTMHKFMDFYIINIEIYDKFLYFQSYGMHDLYVTHSMI